MHQAIEPSETARPIKRSVTIAGHRTSISLEAAFWAALGEIAARQGRSVSSLVTEIDRQRDPAQGLSSSLRVFVLDHFRRGCP